jgi:hypothetical protein
VFEAGTCGSAVLFSVVGEAREFGTTVLFSEVSAGV